MVKSMFSRNLFFAGPDKEAVLKAEARIADLHCQICRQIVH